MWNVIWNFWISAWVAKFLDLKYVHEMFVCTNVMWYAHNMCMGVNFTLRITSVSKPMGKTKKKHVTPCRMNMAVSVHQSCEWTSMQSYWYCTEKIGQSLLCHHNCSFCQLNIEHGGIGRGKAAGGVWILNYRNCLERTHTFPRAK